MHHSIAYLVLNNDPEAVNTGTANGGVRDFGDLVNRRPQLMEWAIGKGYDLFREGTGKLLVPGEKISWDQHLHAVGEEITAGSEIGIWLYPKGQEPKKRSYLVGFTGLRQREFVDIPPNSIAQTDGFTVLKENTLITNFQPHFHLRGKAMQVEAILPDGSNQIVSYVGKFNFNWMTNYIYADDAAPVFPKGTVIHVSAWYDNTKANKFNPDPDQWVGYGDRTVDEMAHAWMNVVYLTDAEYADMVAKRKGRVGVVPAHGYSLASMRSVRRGLRCARRAALALLCAVLSAQQLPSEPRRQFGTSVTGAFEGWWENADGSRTFLVGYLNRNNALEIDVPVGPEQPHRTWRARFRPAGALSPGPAVGHVHGHRPEGVHRRRPAPDLDDRRQRAVHQHPAATAPRLQHQPVQRRRHQEHAAVDSSRRERPRHEGAAGAAGVGAERTVAKGAPLALPLWADDDGRFANATMAPPSKLPSPVELVWSKYRGPGDGDVRQGVAGHGDPGRRARQRAVPRQGHRHGAVQRTRRLRAARHRQRLLRRGRVRRAVLLVHRARESPRHPVTFRPHLRSCT